MNEPTDISKRPAVHEMMARTQLAGLREVVGVLDKDEALRVYRELMRLANLLDREHGIKAERAGK